MCLLCHKASRRLLSCLLVIKPLRHTLYTILFMILKIHCSYCLSDWSSFHYLTSTSVFISQVLYIHTYGPSTHLTFKKQMNLFKTKLLLCRYWQVFSIMTALSCQPVIKSLFSCLRALEGHIYAGSAEKIAQKQSLHKFFNY